MSGRIEIAPEVATALTAGRPVVALETTLVTHGLPHPEGIEVAKRLEQIVRASGATPATVAILDGRASIGGGPDVLERLASEQAVKVNLGNLAATLNSGRAGSTTVAATMALAHRAGIRVFATGGIGGVHRGASESWDVSADLAALARYPLAVVCAGAKALLDLPKTVEALESGGVPILGYRTDRFPAFYRRSSGLPVDLRCDTVEQMASVVATHFALDRRPTGVLVANPVPAEHELPARVYEEALELAISACDRASVRGRDVTPFLLDRLDRLSDGRSVSANLALLESNAELAALLAVALAGSSD